MAIILEELSLPYESEYVDFSRIKQEPFISVNPNGRVPAIEDPNTGLTVWESGAIVEYLLATYDPTNTLSPSVANAAETWAARSWLHFQTSGQGPYFGQRAWFTFYHEEKNLTSALDRYGNEIRRVLGVIDTHLTKGGKKEYLVGSKVTYADLAFVPWFWLIDMPPHMMGADFSTEWKEKFPAARAWYDRLVARPSVSKLIKERGAVLASQKH